eukprot:4963320-Amphidinium_carterae.1
MMFKFPKHYGEHFEQLFNIKLVGVFTQPSALSESRGHFDLHAFPPLLCMSCLNFTWAMLGCIGGLAPHVIDAHRFGMHRRVHP